MPMRPWRGDPERNAIAVAISSGAARFRRAARSSIFASRPPVWATAREVWTTSWRRTPLLHHPEKPRAPLAAMLRVGGLADLHPQSSPLQRREDPHHRDDYSQGDLRRGGGGASQHRAPSRAHGRRGGGSRVLEEGGASE